MAIDDDVPLTPRHDRRPSVLAALLLAVVATIPCWPVLFAGRTFYYRDLYQRHLPQKELTGELVRAGHLPTWDPYLHGGSPLWAVADSATAHPATLLYAVMPAALALGVETALGLILAALGAFHLARRLDLSPPAAFVAGVSISLSGVMLSLVNLHPSFLALSPLPAVLACWDEWLGGGARRWLAAVAGLAALVAMSGGLECAVAGAALVLAWTLVRSSPRSLRARVGALALAGGVALLLSAPSWMPALEVVRDSPRALGMKWDAVGAWSLHPRRLPELLVPGYLGSIESLSPEDYWGDRLEGSSTPYLVSLSLGPVAFLLAVAGALASSRLPRGVRRTLGLFCVLGLTLAMGRHLPGVDAFFRSHDVRLPARFPVKLVFLAVVPFGLLAAAGFDAAVGSIPKERRMAAALLAGGTAILGGFAVVALAAPALASDAVASWFGSDGASTLAGVRRALGGAALESALGCLAVLLASRPTRTRLATGVLAGAVAATLLLAAPGVTPTAPRRLLEAEPPLVADVRAAVGDGRLFRGPADEGSGPRAVAVDYVHGASHLLARLDQHFAARHRVPVVFHGDVNALAPARLSYLSGRIPSLGWEERVPLLRSAGVTAVLTDDAPEVGGLSLAGTRLVSDVETLRIFRVESPADTVRFVPRARVMDSDRLAMLGTVGSDHDPREEVILQGARPAIIDHPGCAGSTSPRSLALEPEQEIAVDAGCDGFVVLALGYQRGIEVTVDDRPVAVVAADFALSAVQVPAGRHVLRWRYRLTSLPFAFACLALGAVGTAGLAAWPRRRLADDAALPGGRAVPADVVA